MSFTELCCAWANRRPASVLVLKSRAGQMHQVIYADPLPHTLEPLQVSPHDQFTKVVAGERAMAEGFSMNPP